MEERLGNVSIISDGTVENTRMLVDGVEVKGLVSVNLDPIRLETNIVRAVIVIDHVKLGEIKG